VKVSNTIKNFWQSSYVKDITTLMTGTGIAQLVPVVTAPILTRIYSGSDFGIYAIYYGLLSILVTLSTLRYESAIYLPSSNRKAINLLMLCMMITVLTSILFFVILFLAEPLVIKLLELEEIGKWVFVLPISLLLTGTYNSLNLWFLRNSSYRFLSKNRVILAVSTAIIQITIGLSASDWKGLIIANVLGQTLALVLYIVEFLSKYKRSFKFISFSNIKGDIKKYKKFPIYSMPSGLVNSISSQLPIFFINSLFGKEVLGFYNIGERFVGLPLSLLSNSIQEVFRQRAATDYLKFNSAKQVFLKTFKTLAFLAFTGFVVILLFGPYAFSFVLGSEWVMSGELMQITCLLIMIRFVASPLSYTILIAGKHQYDLIWQIMLIGLTTFSFKLSYFLNFSVKETLLVFTGFISLLYIVNI
jgi:O-antigen/teichoic acid export membrane protein